MPGKFILNKTPLMLRVEREHNGEPIETLVPRYVEQMGLTRAADALGVSKDTLGKWLLQTGNTIQRRVVPLSGASAEDQHEVD
jgi:hypothetical protein